MSKRSKRLSQVVVRGFEIMLESIPARALVNPMRAENALQRYRLRPDNHLTSAFSDLLQEFTPCLDSDQLREIDIENAVRQVRDELKTWNFQ